MENKTEYITVNCGCCGTGAKQAPTIGENGNWFLGEEDTGVKAQGKDGVTPHIGENGNWFLGDDDTGVKAQGGVTPHIGENGNWFLGEEDTGVMAQGSDGQKGEPGVQGPIGPQGPKGDKGDSGLMEETYSATATRIGTWFDGKPLYRKVFTYGGTVPAFNGGDMDVLATVVTEPQLGNFQQIIKVYGYAINATSLNTTPFPHLRLATVYKPGEGIKLVSEITAPLKDVVVVVEYV